MSSTKKETLQKNLITRVLSSNKKDFKAFGSTQ